MQDENAKTEVPVTKTAIWISVFVTITKSEIDAHD